MRAYLGLGSNLGDPRAQLARAVAELRRWPGVAVTAVSSLYRTAPVGGGPQPDYLNAAAVLETELSPQAVLAMGLELEQRAGRVRRGARNEPRTLDVDILLYADAVIEETDLRVPHPRLAERAFALIPLAEIAPEVRHPVTGKTFFELAAGISSAGIRKLPGGIAWVETDKR